MKLTRYFRFVFALAFPCLWATTALAEKTDLSPFKITIEPLYPLALSHQEITEGRAEFVIAVDNQGTLRDHLLVKTSHPLFGEAVEDVLPSWEFRPSLIDGERVNAMHRLTVNFRSSGMFVVGVDSVSTIKDSRIKLIGGSGNNKEYSVALLPHLDAPPEILQVVHPNIPDSEDIPSEGLRVVYNFFIDKEGRVRIPWLDEQEFQHIDEAILDATYDALMQWEFTPPTVNGKTVVAQVSQPFWFTSPRHSLADKR
ncbi:energy transducer TonB [Opitutaceae bacterium]|nr:energy transducer TonB [Opitutaceae bacterium]